MSVKAATVLATVLSISTILIAIVSLPLIYNEVQSIWLELDSEMLHFRVGKKLNSIFDASKIIYESFESEIFITCVF